MKALFRRCPGVCIVAALTLPLGLILFLGASQAQGQFGGPKPGGFPNPPGGINPPGGMMPPGGMPPGGIKPPGGMVPPGGMQPPGGLNPPNFGNPGGQIFVQVWRCSKCGHTWDKNGSITPPSNCPKCGVRFINGGPDLGNPNPPAVNPPGGFNIPQGPGANNPPANNFNNPVINNSSRSSPPGDEPSDRSTTMFIVLGVVGGLALTGTIVLLVMRSTMS
jgi:hypothetical protein